MDPCRTADGEGAIEALIEPFRRRGVDLGLERMRAALADLGQPDRSYPALQVAGTNGKGSICALLQAALARRGLRSGLTISPHLVSWCERLQLEDRSIAAADLQRLLERIRPVAARRDLTPFECLIAAALVWFHDEAVDLAVLEVGLGGRLDATTAHGHRPVVGFATIGLDHQEHLGSTLGAIAAEKAGVLTAGAVAVSAPQPPEVAAVLAREAQRCGAELRWVAPLDWPCGLAGEVQRANAAVARGMLQALGPLGWSVPEQTMREAFAAARWPGRLQRIVWRGVPLLVDGAHNRPAARSLRQELDGRAPGRSGPRTWVLGILASKDAPGMLAELLGPEDRGWMVPVPGHASWDRDACLERMPSLRGRLHAAESLEEALAMASAHHAARHGGAGASEPLLVTGSLYLIGSLLRQLPAEATVG